MKRVVRITKQGKVKNVGARDVAVHPEIGDVDAKVALIQALIPVALEAVADELQAEVRRLAGPKHKRRGGVPGYVRWCRQQGSIYLGDQKLPVTYQRVRDLRRNAEVPLATYQQLQIPRAADAGLFRKILLGLSGRDYETCAEAVPEAFGLSPSTVSRRFIRASARQLQVLCERRLDAYHLVALFLDGKTFAEDAMVIALGITLTGEKVVLGFVQTATENERVCAAFLRALHIEAGLLVGLDGANGLRTAVATVWGAKALVQRGQWHTREHGVRSLPTRHQVTWRRTLPAAYARPTSPDAQAALLRLRTELGLRNASAVGSLDEGVEETLTLHRLGLFQALGVSLKPNHLPGVAHGPGRAGHRHGRPVADLRPAAALGRQCAARDRAPPAADQGGTRGTDLCPSFGLSYSERRRRSQDCTRASRNSHGTPLRNFNEQWD